MTKLQEFNMSDNTFIYCQFEDGVLKSIDPSDHAREHGWKYVFAFRHWQSAYEMIDLCDQLLGKRAWRGKKTHTMDNHSAKWMSGIKNRIYWRSMPDMKQCCMQYLLTR
jgi:hypothetical protein